MNRFLSVFLSHTMFRLWKYVKDPCSRKSILSETPGFSFRLFKISIKFHRIWDGNGQFGWISNWVKMYEGNGLLDKMNCDHAYWGLYYRRTLKSETTFGNWMPLKNDEKDFYFILQAFFVLKIFKFLARLFGHHDDIKTAWLKR